MKLVGILTPDRAGVAELRQLPDGVETRPGVVVDVVVDPVPDAKPGVRWVQDAPALEAGVARVRWRAEPRFPDGAPVMVSALEFTDRITPDEWAVLYNFAPSIPPLAHALRRLDRAQEVDLRDPGLPAVLELAVQLGAIKQDRIPQILALPGDMG